MTTGATKRPLVEVCVEGLDGLVAAQEAGADRIELCASLLEGGITPSYGTIAATVRVATVPVHVIIRPRGGDFLYSAAEYASTLEDVRMCRELGVAGVVVGCLTADGSIDEARMGALVAAARPLSVTCHRAFDMTRDAVGALESLVACGVDRVLTSGQQPDAERGAPLLAQLVEQAAGRIVVMGCGDLRPENVGRIVAQTALPEIHFAALAREPSPMLYRNPEVGMGGTDVEREYQNTVTDRAFVAATIAAAGGR